MAALQTEAIEESFESDMIRHLPWPLSVLL
jgi:hypothetical protein